MAILRSGRRKTGAVNLFPGDPLRFDLLIAVYMTFNGIPTKHV
jgi:hypothetical protein